jgi:hypothetical protein
MISLLLVSALHAITIKEIYVDSHKYDIGDCVIFDKTKFKQQVDETPMLILDVKVKDYSMLIIHQKVDGKVYFNAVIKKIDELTLRASCPKYLENEK